MNPEGKTGRRFVGDFSLYLVRDPATWALIGFNLAAGVVVLLHPPYTQPLFFLYWCDCILIGFFGALKLFFVPLPLLLVVIFVLVKIVADLAAHFWEHRTR